MAIYQLSHPSGIGDFEYSYKRRPPMNPMPVTKCSIRIIETISLFIFI